MSSVSNSRMRSKSHSRFRQLYFNEFNNSSNGPKTIEIQVLQGNSNTELLFQICKQIDKRKRIDRAAFHQIRSRRRRSYMQVLNKDVADPGVYFSCHSLIPRLFG